MILGAFPSPQLVGFCEVVQQVGFRLPLVCYTFQAICWRSFIVDLIDTAALLRRLVELYPIAGSGILRDVQRLCWMPNPTSEISCRWILPDIIPDLPLFFLGCVAILGACHFGHKIFWDATYPVLEALYCCKFRWIKGRTWTMLCDFWLCHRGMRPVS